MNASSIEDIPANSSIEFNFPSNYDKLLTTPDKKIKCSSSVIPNIICEVKDGRLIIPINIKIPANSSLDIKIEGIVNPEPLQDGTTGGIDILIR